MTEKFSLARAKNAPGILALGLGLVALSVLFPWISRTLDRRTRAAQARKADLLAFEANGPTANLTSAIQKKRELAEARQKVARCEWIQRVDLLQRFEWNTYDWRLGQKLRVSDSPIPVALVYFDDYSIEALGQGEAIPGQPYNYIWPRMEVYGRALRTLRNLGASAIGFDVTFQEHLLETNRADSDRLFARELKNSTTPAILAIAPEIEPSGLFQRPAAAVGDVASYPDADAVPRRVRAYTEFRQQNPVFAELAALNHWNITVSTNHQSIQIQTNGVDPGSAIPVNERGEVRIQWNRFRQAEVPLVVTNRVWHLGLVLAAYQLKVDLKQSEIWDGELLMRATNGAVLRRVPVDEFGYFAVNWNLKVLPRNGGENMTSAAANAPGKYDWRGGMTNDFGIVMQKIEHLVRMDWERTNSAVIHTNDQFKGRLAVIGSTASANNLADRGPTPLGSSEFLVSTYINVANQVLTGESITTPRFLWVAAMMIGLCVTSCLLTWNLRGAWSPLVIFGMALGWFFLALWVFVSYRVALPIVHPIAMGLILPYGTMVSVRAVVEQQERRRVRSVFAKMVSPDIVHEMLGSGRIELGGSRRELSVLFADIRGFTALTDRYQAEAEHHVATHRLSPKKAEAYYDARAREVLETVNLYLAAIADVVKFHHGTLDKYIGDCVMAFWGAPVANPRHSVDCVIAAIDAQRIIARLNSLRSGENDRRTAENASRQESKSQPLPLLPLISLGTGVNTGVVTVGLMGSEKHIVNYTVFGREVNLASRLEGVSGHSRIVIGDATYQGLQKYAPALAQLCRAMDPVTVKGFRAPVQVYEVLWQEAEAAAAQTNPLYQGTPFPGFTPKI